MNKKIIIAAVIVLLILIGGFFYFSSQNKKPQTVSENSPKPTQKTVQNEMPDYARALQGTGSVKCTYTDNGMTATSFIKNGKIKITTTAKGVTTNSLMMDKVVYSWQEGSKTGMMFDTSKMMVSITPSVTGTANYQSPESFKQSLDTYHPQCTNETISDTIFEKPAGVTFSDMSKMMEDVKSKMRANVTLPPNVTIPQGY